MPRTISSGSVIDTPVAFVRGVAASFASALTAKPADPPLSVELAAAQHAGYVAALDAGGYTVVRVEPDDALPDCCFIEDTAVVLGEQGLMTRPGHAARRGEGDYVAALLAEYVPLHHVRDPATVDGGDVLSMGSQVFVGLSRRTNAAGVAAIAAIAEPQGMTVTPVTVGSVLHLKSGLSALDESTVLWHPRACERDDLKGLQVVEVAGNDPESANVVRLADGRILVADHHRGTRDIVDALGFETVTADVAEFARADGGLTCLSIRIR